MRLLDSQVNQIHAVIDQSPFEISDISISYQPQGLNTTEVDPILLFRSDQTKYFMLIGLRAKTLYQLRYSPGDRNLFENKEKRTWDLVLESVAQWLVLVERELAAAARRDGESTEIAPDWALKELPAEYQETLDQIAVLKETERRLRQMAGLWWETGEALNKLVRNAFRDIGFQAEFTEPGATYDVTVQMVSARLLVEITGIEGQVNKGSKKIAQVLTVLQKELQAADRVCVAINAYRTIPPVDRQSLDLLTPEASDLLTRLGAVVFTTSDLFRVWKLSRTDANAARQHIASILGAPAGLFRLGL